jgi:MSHA pilin protein MshD
MCTTERQRGFSLVELIFFIVVVSLGLAGILSVMTGTVAASTDPLMRKQALVLADALMEEIMLKAPDNPPGGYSGNNRALFDDVGDYQGYSTCCGMVAMDGTALPGLERYNGGGEFGAACGRRRFAPAHHRHHPWA